MIISYYKEIPMDTTQHDSPDDEILAYISGTYTPEYGNSLQAALSLLYAFGVDGVQDTLCEMIYDISAENHDSHRIAFSSFIQQEVLRLLSLHGIDIDEARLDETVAVLSAISLVQQCEDPVPYLRVLESNTLSSEEKMARILKDFCFLDETRLMMVFHGVEEGLPVKLYQHLLILEQRYRTEDKTNEEADEQKIVENFRRFESCFGQDTFAHQVLFSGMKIGLPFRLYVAYIGEEESRPEASYILDIFSLMLIAEDTYNRPVAAFRELSDVLLDNPKNYQHIEAEIQKINEKFELYKKEKP